MIPLLDVQDQIRDDYLMFLDHLESQGFDGEVRRDFSSRLVTATDNSIYQVLPQAVVLPKSTAAIQSLFNLATKAEFSGITFSPRGGGTGTNGQSLTTGIVIDCSKYMRGILEVNPVEKWVRVQPGVILDQLNASLAVHGLFFAPNLSPSNRATLGGMINTDACGMGSRVYGRTSNHVLEMEVVLCDGNRCTFSPLAPDQLARAKQKPGLEGRLHGLVDDIVTSRRDLIESTFPKMTRFLTGYNLARVYDDQGRFNLGEIVCGSEGSLAVVTEARLNLTQIPTHRGLMAVKYSSFDDALADAQALLATEPTAIETVDEKILQAARGDEIWFKVSPLIGDDPNIRTVNLVEFTAQEAGELERKLAAFTRQEKNSTSCGFYATRDKAEISALWSLRKKGVGLLGNLPGSRRPIAFIEDTAVPPQHLADYIRELRALLDHHKLQFAMYGHVDVGCLHLRPSLNMQDPLDEKLVRVLSDEVVALVRKYGGNMWAEHGKGFRSEYTSQFFGDTLYKELRRIKGAFDPRNILNPGKVVSPLDGPDTTVAVEAPLRGHFDRQIGSQLQGDFSAAINCNGNGVCFNYNPHDVICPSSKITGDRIHSPKGRATLIKEWLRRLSQSEASKGGAANLSLGKIQEPGSFLARLGRGIKPRSDDFSHEVYDAMRGCLSCKACTTQCPIHVDISHFKAQFLQAYHGRYPRPLRDLLVGNMEQSLALQTLFPRLVNGILGLAPIRALVRRVGGLVDAPALSVPTLKSQMKKRRISLATLDNLENGPDAVLLVQDAFVSYYETSVFWAAHDLLVGLGFKVKVLPYVENGKPLHVKGFVDRFRRVAEKNSAVLAQAAKSGIPMVGIEPSIVLTYRDEYPKALGRSLDFKVALIQEFLINHLARLKEKAVVGSQPFELLAHCMEKTGAPGAEGQWRAVFEALGLELKVLPSGCCGMAGTYGHEDEHLKESRGIFDMSWGLYLQGNAARQNTCLATGYSCRSQVKRFLGYKPKHPCEVLLTHLNSSPS